MRVTRLRIMLTLALTITLIPDPVSAKERQTSPSEKRQIVCREVSNSDISQRDFKVPRKLLKTPPRLITLVTNCGPISIRPLNEVAPWAVTFFTSIMQQKFYDGTYCHRLTVDLTSFLQCGDPTGTGVGDQVFTYNKENLPKNRKGMYRKGTVVVQSRQGISSQFLIFYEDTILSQSYSVWGNVVSGLEIIDFVADQGVLGGGTDGAPEVPVQILRVVIR